jgi:hypothetical protein
VKFSDIEARSTVLGSDMVAVTDPKTPRMNTVMTVSC